MWESSNQIFGVRAGGARRRMGVIVHDEAPNETFVENAHHDIVIAPSRQ
jgi:hypothetical protein